MKKNPRNSVKIRVKCKTIMYWWGIGASIEFNAERLGEECFFLTLLFGPWQVILMVGHFED